MGSVSVDQRSVLNIGDDLRGYFFTSIAGLFSFILFIALLIADLWVSTRFIDLWISIGLNHDRSEFPNFFWIPLVLIGIPFIFVLPGALSVALSQTYIRNTGDAMVFGGYGAAVDGALLGAFSIFLSQAFTLGMGVAPGAFLSPAFSVYLGNLVRCALFMLAYGGFFMAVGAVCARLFYRRIFDDRSRASK